VSTSEATLDAVCYHGCLDDACSADTACVKGGRWYRRGRRAHGLVLVCKSNLDYEEEN